MGQRAPRSLLLLLFLGLILSGWFSWYMEINHLDWLQRHPISVNLISGCVGFCGGFLTLAIVFNWVMDRESAFGIAFSRYRAWVESIHEIRKQSVPLRIFAAYVHFGKSEIKPRPFLNRFAIATKADPVPATLAEYEACVDRACATILNHARDLEFAWFGEFDSLGDWPSAIGRSLSQMNSIGESVVQRVREAGANPEGRPSPETVLAIFGDIEAMAQLARQVTKQMARWEVAAKRHQSESV